MVLRLLPWGPACCLQFRHATVELGPASGIPAPTCYLRLAHVILLGDTTGVAVDGGLEVIRDLRDLGTAQGLLSPPFCCRRGHSHRTCSAAIACVHVKDERRVDESRGRGGHGDSLLDLAGSQRLLGEKVRSQGVLFRGFLESHASDTNLKLVG